jgi:Fur family peroxide stress response transcriptional regulator
MKRYKDLGIKLTPQRLAILNYLEGNTDHPSAEEIFKAVSVQFPTMSFATVYNTLDTLRKKGWLMEVTIDPDKKRFDPCTEYHHHLICRSCKKVVDIKLNFGLELPAHARDNFTITGNHVDFYGTCPDCRGSAQA